MAKLSGSQKRDKILESARKIFYDQGYNGTYLEHIAKDCGISKQLLIYYYPSKSILADYVLLRNSEELKDLVNQRMRHYFGGMDDLQVCTAVEIKLINLQILRDKKVQRFQLETQEILNATPWTEEDFRFYQMHLERYNLDIDVSRDELRMLASVFSGGITVLLTNYCSGIIRCSESQFLDYIIEVLYRLMKVDRQRINEINKMSNAILEILNFQFRPYFKIE